MSTKKTIVFRVILCIFLLSIIWGVYYMGMKYLWRHVDVCADDYSWVFQIEDIKEEEKEWTLSGFAFQSKVDAKKNRAGIILQDIETGKKLFTKSNYRERKDVNDYFSCQYNYLNSGFEASIKETRVNKEAIYEILLWVKERNVAYKTGMYIVDGELEYANPKMYEAPDLGGTGIEKIVADGVVRMYNPVQGMYVYQYEGYLYWIAEKDYDFVNGDTLVQYQATTTQVDRLPIGRLKEGWDWDNMSFWFSESELTDVDTGEYRVTRRKIPTEYSIEKIWTGNHDGEWIWIEEFRPIYEFE